MPTCRIFRSIYKHNYNKGILITIVIINFIFRKNIYKN